MITIAQHEREVKAADILEDHSSHVSTLKDLSLKEGEKVHISINSSSVSTYTIHVHIRTLYIFCDADI